MAGNTYTDAVLLVERSNIPGSGAVGHIYADSTTHKLRFKQSDELDGQVIVDNLSGAPAKGAVMVHDGTNWRRLPTASDGRVLSTNSGASTGLAWAPPAGDVTGTIDNLQVVKLGGNLLNSGGARTALGLGIGVDVQAYSSILATIAAGGRYTLLKSTISVSYTAFSGLAAGVKTYDIPWVTLPSVAIFDTMIVPSGGANYFDAGGAHVSVTASIGDNGDPTAILAATHVDFSSIWSEGVLTTLVPTRENLGGTAVQIRFTSLVDLNTLNAGSISLDLYAFGS